MGAGKERENVEVELKPETHHSDNMQDQTHGSKTPAELRWHLPLNTSDLL